MDEQTSAELKRLENIIRQNVGAVRGLSDKVAQLSNKVSNMELQHEHDKESDRRKEKQIEDLTLLLTEIKSQFDIMNARNQGVSMTLKVVWTIFGAMIMTGIYTAGSNIIDLKTQIAVIQNRNEK